VDKYTDNSFKVKSFCSSWPFVSSLLDISAVVRVLSGGVPLSIGCVGDPVVGDSIVHWFYFLSLLYSDGKLLWMHFLGPGWDL